MAISRKLLTEGEVVVIDTRTHVKALLKPMLALILFLAIGVVAQTYIKHDTVSLVVWILMALATLWFVVGPFLVWYTSAYAFTDRRLITRTGVITRRGHDIPLSRISDIAIERQLIDRLLGCGTLIITNASTHGTVDLHDIPRVEQTQRRLHDLLHDLHEARRADEGA